jgi:acyl-CoA synthetase (AMP-forming)/AMP-acid ligase II
MAVNIVDAFLFQARHTPTAPAIVAPGMHYQAVSYGRLQSFMNNIAARVLSTGLRRGETVALGTVDPVFHLALVLALTKLGIVTLSLGSKIPDEIHIDAVLSDRPEGFDANRHRVIPIDLRWMNGDGRAPEIAMGPNYGGGPATAGIIMTSGTTGDPKAVALSHDMMLRRFQAYDVAFGSVVPSCQRFFLDIGLASSFGYTWSLWILARGGAIFLRAADPAETLQSFSLYKVQCMIAAPAGVTEFLDYYERSPDFTCPFEVVMASGSLVSRALSERVRARMCDNLIVTYGATEISPMACSPAHRLADIKGAVGHIAPWVETQIVDENDQPIGFGQEGIVRMRGHTCVSGYLGDPKGSETFFRNGWFYPGDIGSLTDDRLLIISGRQKAVLNVGGNKINPETIEAVMSAFPGVLHSAAFARPNELGIDQIWAVVTANEPIQADALRNWCARHLASPFVPVEFVQIGKMPLNEMGRIDRKSLPKAAESR